MFIHKHFRTNYKLFRKKEEKSSFSSSTRSTLMIFPLASTAMVSAVSTSVCLSVCLYICLQFDFLIALIWSIFLMHFGKKNIVQGPVEIA